MKAAGEARRQLHNNELWPTVTQSTVIGQTPPGQVVACQSLLTLTQFIKQSKRSLDERT